MIMHRLLPVGAYCCSGEHSGDHILASSCVRSDDFVTAAAFLPGTQLVAAAAGSSRERANEFAQRHGFQRAHGSYLELAQDKDVDIVYVGNVHPQHRVRLRPAWALLQGCGPLHMPADSFLWYSQAPQAATSQDVQATLEHDPARAPCRTRC